MSANQQLHWISEEEYREGEELSLEKHEWFQGQVFPMGDWVNSDKTKVRRRAVSSKDLGVVVQNALRGTRFQASQRDSQVQIEALSDSNEPTPIVALKISSQSTQSYDRARKFDNYQQIESLTDYVLIEQSEVRVEHFRRTPEGWLLRVFTDIEATLRLENVEIELPLAEIYEELEVPDRADAPQTMAPRGNN